MRTLIGPTAEPLHLNEIKHHLRVTDTAEDFLLTNFAKAARQKVENETGLKLVHQQIEWTHPHFSPVIELPTGPLSAVSAIKYIDTSGTEQTVATDQYNVIDRTELAMIEEAYGEVWPSTRDQGDAVRIQFWAGYGVPFTADMNADTLTAENHQFANGDIVRVQISGNENDEPPGGLTEGENYYVINVSGDTLQLSETEGGSTIDITGNGTGSFFLAKPGREIPPALRHAILLLTAHIHENREATISGTIITELPMGVDALIGPYRQHHF